MDKDVCNGSLVEVPYHLSSEADFAVSVWMSGALIAKYVAVHGASVEEQEMPLSHILHRCRREIDCWSSEKDVYEVECVVVAGIHSCCHTPCTQLVTLKAVYRENANGTLWLAITLPSEK